MSGLHEDKQKSLTDAGGGNSGQTFLNEVRELVSSDEANDHELSEAIALSMIHEDDPSAKQRFDSFGIQKSKEHDVITVDDSFDNDIVLIPTDCER